MPLDPAVILAWPFHDIEQAYAEKDAILYALGVGLGQHPLDADELRYVYEKDLRVLPTYPVALCNPGAFLNDPASTITPAGVLHGEVGIDLHRLPAPSGRLRARDRVDGVTDKGAGGAIIHMTREMADAHTGEPVATIRNAILARADGGFGGPFQPVRTPHPTPQRAPDRILTSRTFPSQALLYRLNGDYNPLHVDPAAAARAGFSQPILHGLATFGVAACALLRAECGWDPARFASIDVRFSAPVLPGDELQIQVWDDGDDLAFTATVEARGATVLKNGRLTLRR